MTIGSLDSKKVRLFVAFIGGITVLFSVFLYGARILKASNMCRAFLVNTIVIGGIMTAIGIEHKERHFLCEFMFARLLTFIGDRAFATKTGYAKFQHDPRIAIRAAIGHVTSEQATRYAIVSAIEYIWISIIGRFAHRFHHKFRNNMFNRMADKVPGGSIGIVNSCVGMVVVFIVATVIRDRYVYGDESCEAFENIVVACVLASCLATLVFNPAPSATITLFGLVVVLILSRALFSYSKPNPIIGKIIIVGIFMLLLAVRLYPINNKTCMLATAIMTTIAIL